MEQANNIFHFKKVIERYSLNNNVYFRGQGANYEYITSSIARDEGYLNNEYALYNESIELKQNEFTSLSYPIQRLAKLQHYGIPTRLIDVTTDPLIALFFAVQNTKNDDGYVYLYPQKTYELNSKKISLLSLLATLKDYDIENIHHQYNLLFNDTITKEEILNLVEETAFVKHSEELKGLNPRLYNQKGTFAICGNIVVGETIQRQLKTLDSIEPLIVIKIPYEYKASVKQELDEKYGINEPYIYPELPSVADYIKEKYKCSNFSSDGMYTLMEKSDISHAGARRISLVIVLTKPLHIDKIRKVAMDLMEENSNNDVVWVYVAKNGSDYIMRNWILRGQWINKTLNEKYKPLPIGKMDSKGYFWYETNDYSVLSDFYEENIFKDDKTLFVKNQGYYEKIRPLFDKLQSLYISQKFDLFRKEVIQKAEKINGIYMIFSDFGHSKEKEFDDFLQNYKEFISLFDNIPIWIKRADLNDKVVSYQVSICFRDANKIVELIDSKSGIWKEKLNITHKDFEEFRIYIK